MGDGKRTRDRLDRDAQKLIREKLATGEWKRLIDGDEHYAVAPDGGQFLDNRNV